MPSHVKTSFKYAVSLIIICSPVNTLFAQQVKKSSPPKKSTTATKKSTPTTSKTSTAVKKTPAVPAKAAPIQKTTIPVADQLTARENQMVEEINLVRTDPAGYVTHVKEYLMRSDADKRTLTAANELMEELKRLKPLNPLKVSSAMYRDAKNYGAVMIENNSTDHSDLPYNENLSFGIENIREAIIDLLIDEGISDRGHRKNILNPTSTLVAVHELPGKVEDYPYCYIQEFK